MSWRDKLIDDLVAKAASQGQTTYDEAKIKSLLDSEIEADQKRDRKDQLGYAYIKENYSERGMSTFFSQVRNRYPGNQQTTDSKKQEKAQVSGVDKSPEAPSPPIQTGAAPEAKGNVGTSPLAEAGKAAEAAGPVSPTGTPVPPPAPKKGAK